MALAAKMSEVVTGLQETPMKPSENDKISQLGSQAENSTPGTKILRVLSDQENQHQANEKNPRDFWLQTGAAIYWRNQPK